MYLKLRSLRIKKLSLFYMLIISSILFWIMIYKSNIFRNISGGNVLFTLGEIPNAFFGIPENARHQTCNGCFTHDYNIIINPIFACNVERSQTIELLILINSKQENRKLRDRIRKSWALYPKNDGKVRHVFMLGLPDKEQQHSTLVKEAADSGDILQEDFIDSYRNLTIKTIMGLTWATKYCSHAKYIMKTDDDILINPKALLQKIKEENLTDAVFGTCLTNVKPIRDKLSKWYISTLEYPEYYYRPYCEGTGYVMTPTMARKIVGISKNVPFVYLEDVYVGLCLHEVGGNVKNVPGFNIDLTYKLLFKTDCDKFNELVITCHGLGEEERFEVWAKCGHVAKV